MGIPDDVKQTCLWIAKGYERRRRWYLEQRDIIGHGGGGSAPAKALERSPEVARMRAVEQALVRVGADIPNDAVREGLRKAMMQNVKNGRAHPFEYLGDLGVSRSDFYRRKDKFLEDIAVQLGMV